MKKIKIDQKRDEAVITGGCKINGIKCAIAVMESQFMMGSMGTVRWRKNFCYNRSWQGKH
ncbi:hypothetical protein [Lachnobacterium bovis]|uniref:hypothetical protein n=1 Tax=Lachnobacterium bovis TaxID=140626 RepID=UPI00048DA8CE|nr:hypothetical protein [Lachnobacterium bovis]